ncbi:MAG: hypothetical protein ACAI38_12490 [Myxococcota bacterium]
MARVGVERGAAGVTPTSLRFLGAPVFASRADLTKRELDADRRQRQASVLVNVRRDLLQPTPQVSPGVQRLLEAVQAKMPALAKRMGVEKLLTPVDHYSTRLVDKAVLATAAGVGVALVARIASKDIPLDAVPELIGCAVLGAFVADGLAWGVHVFNDLLKMRRHVPGEPMNAGSYLWLHHIMPSLYSQQTWVRAVAGLLPVGIAFGAGTLVLDPSVAWMSFMLAFSTAAGLAQGAHRAAHDANPGQVTRAFQRGGALIDNEHHGGHHWGVRECLLTAEEPMRHTGSHQGLLGWLSPIRQLDTFDVASKLEAFAHRFLGRTPVPWQDYPELKEVALAPKAMRPELEIKGRLSRYERTIAWFREELAACANTLAKVTDATERGEAEGRLRELEELIPRMVADGQALDAAYRRAVARRRMAETSAGLRDAQREHRDTPELRARIRQEREELAVTLSRLAPA